MIDELLSETRFGPYMRRVFENMTLWVPSHIWDNDELEAWYFEVARIPFIEGYHVIEHRRDDDNDGYEWILSTHKTLSEAMNITKILLASPSGTKYL